MIRRPLGLCQSIRNSVISWPLLFATALSEVVEQLAALAAGAEHLDPARPAATNGIVWAGAHGHRDATAEEINSV